MKTAEQVAAIIEANKGKPALEVLLALGEHAPGEAGFARGTMAKQSGDLTQPSREWLDEIHKQAPELFGRQSIL